MKLQVETWLTNYTFDSNSFLLLLVRHLFLVAMHLLLAAT